MRRSNPFNPYPILTLALTNAALAATAWAAPAAGAAPTPAQMQAAIDAAAREFAVAVPRITPTGDCYPASAEHPDTMLCIARQAGRDEDEEIAFRATADGWRFVADGGLMSAACPQGREAATLVRGMVHFPNVEIADTPDAGELTDERGILQDRKGPLRLSCAYGISSDLGEFTLLAYFRYVDGHYLADAEKELLPD